MEGSQNDLDYFLVEHNLDDRAPMRRRQ
jgi:hypothetical protein